MASNSDWLERLFGFTGSLPVDVVAYWIVAFVGFVVLLWSVGENDRSIEYIPTVCRLQ
jgi:hypothetical protein